MCVLCLAAQRSLDDCAQSNGDPEQLAPDVVMAASGGTVVNDERSILFYLDGGDNFRWNGNSSLGSKVTITYSFADNNELPSVNSSADNPYGASRFSEFTASQKANFRLAAQEFMSVSGIVLVETSGVGDIEVYNASGTSVGGYADLPYVSGGYTSDVDLVIDSGGSYAPGTYGYYTLLHELGHAVGLDHTHDGAYTLSSGMDTTDTTVMSYNYAGSVTGLESLDVSALQTLYGSSALSSGWSLKVNAAGRLKAEGSAGSDSYTGTVNIKGVSIKSKVLGHGGNDVISGQGAKDVLHGNEGGDSLNGLGGDDFLRGGSGNDTLYGGSGDDYINGGSGNDVAYGGSGADQLFGKTGNDTLYGEDGNDRLYGGNRQDYLSGGGGNDTLDGGIGTDILTGGSGVDVFVFIAGSGHDTVTDFDTNGETLRFSGTGLSFGDLTFGSNGADALVYAGSAVIELDGVSVASLDATDFEFI